MAPGKAVLVIGDLNADLILTGLSSRPVYGREVLVRGCRMTLGGSAANFACGLARLGRPVRFVGEVGRDPTGDMLVDLMRRRGVDVEGVRRDGKVGTGIAVALSERRERALLSFLGTVETARLRKPASLRFADFAHLHLTSPFLQEGLRPEFPRLLRRAQNAGLLTSLDPGWDPRGKWDLEKLYPWLTFLLVNESEAEALTGEKNPRKAAIALARKVPVAVVKIGPRGAVGAMMGDLLQVPSYPVQVVDTTGAGDAFDAGFIDAWLDGDMKPSDALRFGCACGALSTTRPGGYEGQATRPEALRLMRRRR
jgi:sugar/nucleoside kinase (ribokinase family)